MYFRETDYDDTISLDYRKKSAVWTASENLIQEESHADGKDKHFATLATFESSCVPKRKPLRPYLGRRPWFENPRYTSIPCRKLNQTQPNQNTSVLLLSQYHVESTEAGKLQAPKISWCYP